MSQENVEIVTRLAEAYLRGDLDEALSALAPDIEYKRAEEAMVRGRDAVRAGWEQWEADWEDLETIPEDPTDAGDHVVLPVLFRGRGRGSGIEIEDRFYEVFELRDGKVVRWDEFSERSEALEAAGLSE
jgi:ketosteroid isomerase-like protein